MERRFARLAIGNLTALLIAGQCVFYVLILSKVVDPSSFALIPAKVFEGEVWRLLVFLFIPQFMNPLCFLIGCLFFHWIGTTLETQWGYVKYNIFVFTGYLGTLLAAALASIFFSPEFSIPNFILYETIFLAFAWLYPEVVIHLFFILPCKVKWLAWLTWAHIGFLFIVTPWTFKIVIIAALSNYILFFGGDIIRRTRSMKYQMKTRADRLKSEFQAFHTCRVCGKTDLTHPDMDFRYCPTCDDSAGYCSEHIHRHQCVNESGDKPSA